jgi:hypothetical protein
LLKNLLDKILANINCYFTLAMVLKYENDTDLQPECEYFTDNGSQWEYYTWVFTPTGISITTYLPHVMTPCKTGFPLTYEELKQDN